MTPTPVIVVHGGAGTIAPELVEATHHGVWVAAGAGRLAPAGARRI